MQTTLKPHLGQHNSALLLPQGERLAALRISEQAFAVVALLAAEAALILFFRPFFVSGYDAIAGNVGDNRFIIAILEHWYRFYCGLVPDFASPIFFAPERGVLGYSESLFLFSLPYSAARALGVGHYIAFQITLLVLKAIGFAGMYVLLRSVVQITRWAALVGAVLFTLSNMYYLSVGHAQLIAVVFCPVMAILLFAYHRQRAVENVRAARAWLIALAVLEALLLFTSFYIGWFALLTTGVLAVVFGLGSLLKAKSVSGLRKLAAELSRRRVDAVVGLIAFALALAPFVWVYAPTLRQTGGRRFAEALYYAAEPIDAVNVGGANAVWGKHLLSLRPDLPQRQGEHEKERGWPPVMVLMFLGTTGFCLAGSRRQVLQKAKRSGDERLAIIGAVLGTGCLLLWMISLKYGEYSPWWLVFHFLPGGSAIRVPVRINLVLNVLVITVVSIGVQRLSAFPRRIRHRSLAIVLGGLVATLLVIEHWNTTPTHAISRSAEDQLLSSVQPAPSGCDAFYVVGPADQRPFFATQIDAMFIALARGIPTINGYSGWTPTGWNLLTLGPGYVPQAYSWARQKGLAEHLCEVDLRSGRWRHAGVLDQMQYELGDLVDFKANGNALRFQAGGWWQSEPGGTWTVGNSSTLTMDLTHRTESDLSIDIEGHAFTSTNRPVLPVSVLVNDNQVATWMLTGAEAVVRRRVRVSNHTVSSGKINITFVNHDPRSPADLGLSADDRKIGLALHSLVIRKVDTN